jgi:putative ABC transport system permease protein
MRTLWQDLRYTLRLARRNPVFTAVAVLSLTLGIGANTILFSIVYGVLLKSLPYRQPDRLTRLVHTATETDITMPEFQFWKEHATVFDSVAASRNGEDALLVIDGVNKSLGMVMVTTDYFRTLGVSPALGREFNSEETHPDGPGAVILTYSLWKRALGGDPAIIDHTIMLGDAAYRVVGVLPSGFWYPQGVDAFVPLRVRGNASDMGFNSEMIGRLKPGIDFRSAAAATTVLRDQFRKAGLLPYPLDSDYPGLTPIPYARWLTGDVRTILLILSGAVGVLLLVACSNLASLVLARLAVRQKEIALRLALGSSRARLVGQFLTENLLLSAAGATGAAIGASAVLPELLALIPFHLPAASAIRIDTPVLAFTMFIALMTAVLLSLAPCLISVRFDIHESLKTAGRASGTTPVKQRTRSALVVCQVALSVILLVAALLLSESLYRVTHQELGFRPHDLITFRVTPPEGRRSNPAAERLFETSLLDRLSSLQGAGNVAGVNVVPLRGQNNFPTQRLDHPEQSIGGMEIRVVTPEYFKVMGIPIRGGRAFTSSDTSDGQPVIAVSQAVVRAWWKEKSPLGDHVVIGLFQGRVVPEGGTADSPRQIVAVVGDTKGAFMKAPPRPTVYVPAAQAGAMGGSLIWIVRDGANGIATDLQKTVNELDPRRRVEDLRPMDEIVASTTTDSRFNAELFGSFAMLAVLLAAMGVFGLLSFSVAQRTHEIGTRMALGASRGHILTVVFKQGITLVGSGTLLGIGAALLLTRYLSSLLFQIRAVDAFTYFAASILLLTVGAFATYLPARYAAKVDPVVALRSE